MKWNEWKAYAENVAHWQDHQERGLLKSVHLRDYILQLWFEEELDVTIYELDFAPLLMEENLGPVYSPLKNSERFAVVKGDYALMWLNPETYDYDEGVIDMAPECIRFFCERYGKLIKGCSS